MISIRQERAQDDSAIASVTAEAFRDSQHAGGYEHLIPGRLRDKGVLTISLVAEENGSIVGHVAFSPVRLSDGSEGWFGLGPVSVLPALQGKGVGHRLIVEGLDHLRQQGAAGCVVLGDPAYYSRFGFRQDTGLTYAGAPPEYFMELCLRGNRPAAAVTYDAAFDP